MKWMPIWDKATERKSPVFCSVDLFTELKQRYSARRVEPCLYASSEVFYYFSTSGRVRKAHFADKRLFGCDIDRGFPYMKIIRG